MIHCIGDSHAQFFTANGSLKAFYGPKLKDRIPLFKTYILGPVLAFNLNKLGTKSQGKEKLLKTLENIPTDDYLMLIFGEIDCRAQILKQSKITGKPWQAVTKECVRNYTTAISEIKKLGFSKVIIWNVIPSTPAIKQVIDYPIFGSCRQRNEITKLFNSLVNSFARKHQILTLSIFSELVDHSGQTKKNYHLDEIHLSPKALPLALKKLDNLHIVSLELFTSPFLKSLSKTLQFKLFDLQCLYSHYHGKFFRSLN